MSSGVALRSALAQCAAALCQDEEKIEILRQSGLLTTDLRARERKKAGKQRARRAFPWYYLFFLEVKNLKFNINIIIFCIYIFVFAITLYVNILNSM